MYALAGASCNEGCCDRVVLRWLEIVTWTVCSMHVQRVHIVELHDIL